MSHKFCAIVIALALAPCRIAAAQGEQVLLEDAFDGSGPPGSQWTVGVISGATQNPAIGVTQTGGALEIGSLSAGGYNGAYSTSTYDFTNGCVRVAVVQVPTEGGDYTMLTVVQDVNNFYRVWINAGTIGFEKKVNGTKTVLNTVAYNATDDRYLGICQSNGAVQFQTGASATAMVTRYPDTWDPAISLAALRFELKAGNSATVSTVRSARFDDFHAASESQTPFSGAPINVPGTIAAEDFDLGGEGVAYHDNVPGNSGGVYRPDEDVDLLAATGNASGYVVHNFETGEWLEYTINVTATGTYNVTLNAATQFTTSAFHIEVDGTPVSASTPVPSTGLWSNFVGVTVNNVNLSAGVHVLRVYMDQQYFDLDAISIATGQLPFGGTAAAVPGTFEAENFDQGGEGVAYHDLAAGNAGGAYRTAEDVDIIAAGGNASGYVVNNIQTGEWLEYTINVAATGTYTIALHASNNYTGTPRFHLEIDGNALAGSTAVPNTGSWTSFTFASVSGVSLTAGLHVLRVQSDQEYFNLDSIQITDNSSTCNTVRVPAGGDLQGAINAAVNSSCTNILLGVGTPFVNHYTLKPHAAGGYVTITTDGTNIPGPTERVTTAYSGSLATLQSPDNLPVFTTADSTAGYQLVALEILPNNNSAAQGTAIVIGSATTPTNDVQPQDIVMDRLLVRGRSDTGQKRGIEMHGTNITIKNSWISDIKGVGQDTQAIYSNNGWGPYEISNNYIEAAGENILFGGDDPRIPNMIPGDITIDGNTITKPLSWMGQSWQIKNLVEFKNAQRVTVTRNTVSNAWAAAQGGFAFVLTPRNQNGGANWVVVKDVTIEHNRIVDVSNAFSLQGYDNLQTSQTETNIVMSNNLIVIKTDAGFGGHGWIAQILRSPQYITIERNTTDVAGSSWMFTDDGTQYGTTSAGLIVRDNLTLHRNYGFNGSCSPACTYGTSILQTEYPGYTFTGNVMGNDKALSGLSSRYPANNTFPTLADFKAEFVNWDAGDYHLKSGSAYTGKGVDFSQLP